MSFSQKTRKKSCWQLVYVEQPPLTPELNPANFLSVGTLKVLTYPVATEKEETIHQRVSRPLRPFKTASRSIKLCDSTRSNVSMCVLIGVEYMLSIPCELELGKQ